MALVLLSGAALLIGTLISLRLVDRGFTARNVLTARVLRSEDTSATTARLHDVVERGVERLQALPGVVAAAATCCLPLEADWRTSFSIVGRTGTPTSDVSLVSYRIISPQYLDALTIPLQRGRGFTSRDVVGTPAVALINQAMARRFWRDADPIGDQILVFPGVKPDEDPPRQIVGIVGDTLDGLVLTATEQPTVYVPLGQLPDHRSVGWPLAWIVRTRAPAPALAAALRTVIDRTSDGEPVTAVVSLDEMIQEADRPVRFSTAAFTSFALVALLLACVGVAAVIAVVVQQRTPELSVRLALGATPGHVRWLMLRDGLRLIVGGIAVGWISTTLLSQWLIGFLFRVEPANAAAPLASAVLLLAVGVLAVWGPARRAARISPITALRST